MRSMENRLNRLADKLEPKKEIVIIVTKDPDPAPKPGPNVIIVSNEGKYSTT
jgi:hypothetical protein